MSIEIVVQNATEFTPVPEPEDFTRWVEAAIAGRCPAEDLELCIRLVDVAESAELNLHYRKKTGPTNILSFPGELSDALGVYLLGDLVICAPLMAEEATQQQKTFEQHWAHLTVHGTLHLLGYDHQTEEEAAVMENLEIAVLADLGYPNPYC